MSTQPNCHAAKAGDNYTGTVEVRGQNHLWRYRAYGLAIESELELQFLAGEFDAPNVTIRFGSAPPSLEDAVRAGALYSVGRGEFLLRVPDVAAFYVRAGAEIIIDPAPRTRTDDLRAFLQASVIGAVLHQRGVVALHASGIEVDGGAVLFAGRTGVGKSSLAAAFVQRGYPLLTDDICALELRAGRPWLLAGAPQQNLWADTLTTLGVSADGLASVRGAVAKYHMPTLSFQDQPLPVRAVYILRHFSHEPLRVAKIGGVRKVQALLRCVFRPQYLTQADDSDHLLPTLTAAAFDVRLYEVNRSLNYDDLPELMRLIAQTFEAS